MPKAKNSATTKGKETTKRPIRQSARNKNVAEMFAKQKTTGKRAKSNQHDEEGDEEDELTSEESDASASEDSEVEISSNKRRRTNKSHEKRGTQSTRKQRRTKRSNGSPTEVSLTHSSQLLEQVPADNNNSLYDQVSASGSDIEEIAASWVDGYRRDKAVALRSLVNFIIRGCGCMTGVTEEAFDKDDIAIEVLQELQEELAKLPQPEYPVISKSKSGKLLKRNILDFFNFVVEQCQHEIIYDGAFIETLQSWLTTMSSSVYRPFRHTATILTFRIMKSLCAFADKITREFEVVARQLKTETERKSRTRNTEKKRMLEQRSRTLERKKNDLHEFLTEFFDGVFIHRSRDVESVIRMECVRELCLWIQQYTAHFVQNQYLRYFGWALNDSNASVRSESLKAITRLYQVESIVEKLEFFTQRFRERMEEMALYDIDLSVRLRAIELCYTLFQQKHDWISDNTRDELMNLVFVDNERLQKTVAPFVKAVMDTKVLDPMMEETERALEAMNVNSISDRTTTETAVQKSWISLKCLASFLVERAASEHHNDDSTEGEESNEEQEGTSDDLVENAVQALWTQMPELHDYKAFADYLTRDHSSSQQDEEELAIAGQTTPAPIEECYRLAEEEETILVKIFATSLKLITEKGFVSNKDKKKVSDEAQLEENRSTISRYLVEVLPRLLKKHSDSTDKMVKLIAIPQLMNVNVYAELRMQAAYEELLQLVIKVYIGATKPELLQSCARSLQHMSEVDLLADVNERQLPELLERVNAQVRDACRGKDILTARFDADDIHATTTSLLRLDYLVNFIDMTDMMDESEDMDEDVTELAGYFVDRAASGYKKEKQSSLSAMSILFRYIVWKCERISADPELNEAGRAAVGKIERRRDWIMEKFISLVTSTDITPLPAVKATAFGILMDLYWVFSSDLFSDNGLDLLHLTCPADVQERCETYIASELDQWKSALEENADSQDSDESDTQEGTTVHNGAEVIANVARAITAKVLDYRYAVPIIAEYHHLEQDADDIIRALIEETAKDLVGNESQVEKVCHMYSSALKQAFESHVSQAPRSLDKVLPLARLISQTVHAADQEDPARHVAPHVIRDRIHIDGVTYALAKATEHKNNHNRAAMGVSLKFFKVLTVMTKTLTRARDVAKIHKHIEQTLEQHELTVEQDKEWDGYNAYIKDLDQILKKKGFRYDNQQAQQ